MCFGFHVRRNVGFFTQSVLLFLGIPFAAEDVIVHVETYPAPKLEARLDIILIDKLFLYFETKWNMILV